MGPEAMEHLAPQQSALVTPNSFFEDALETPEGFTGALGIATPDSSLPIHGGSCFGPNATPHLQARMASSAKGEQDYFFGRKATARPPMTLQAGCFPESASHDDHLRRKKRGRKPKKQLRDLEPSDREDGEDLDEDGLPLDPRRRRILERNRIAATKCRLRKRDEASALASQEQEMEEKHRRLAAYFDTLSAEIYHLKTQLLQHTHCNCILIQKYIAHEARKSVDNMVGGISTSTFPEPNSSSVSSTDSLHASPEGDGVQTPWCHPFHHTPGATGPRGNIIEDGTEEFQEPFLTPVQLEHMSAAQFANGYFDGCGNILTPDLVPDTGNSHQAMDSYCWEEPWVVR